MESGWLRPWLDSIGVFVRWVVGGFARYRMPLARETDVNGRSETVLVALSGYARENSHKGKPMTSQADHLLFDGIRKIRVLMENQPVGNDLIHAYNSMVLGFFVTHTHLEIEKGLKWAILKSGGSLQDSKTHSIRSLIQRLEDTGDTGRRILKYIREAFQSVKRFYKIDDGRRGFRHLKTLDSYFGAVGGKDVYESARYGILESISDDSFSYDKWSSPKLRQVWNTMHIEIMRALEEVIIGSWNQKPRTNENVELRVERLFHEAVFHALNEYSTRNGGVDLLSFQNWETGFDSVVELIGEAVRKSFTISDNEQFNAILMLAYSNLRGSDDPAVRYRLDTFSYLPMGSVQPMEGIDLSRVLKSVNERNDYFKISDSMGETLGFIEQKLDRSWQINMVGVYGNPIFKNAWNRDDAIWFLIRHRVRLTQFVVNGESQQHLIIDKNPTHGIISQLETGEQVGHPIENILDIFFWNEKHELETGDRVAFRVVEPEELREPTGYAKIVVGEITSSEGHKVTLKADGPFLTELELDQFLAKYAPAS